MAAKSDHGSASPDVFAPSHRSRFYEDMFDELTALITDAGNDPVLQQEAEPIHVHQGAVTTDRDDQNASPVHACLAQCTAPARQGSRGSVAHDGELLAKQHEREQTQMQQNRLQQGQKVRI